MDETIIMEKLTHYIPHTYMSLFDWKTITERRVVTNEGFYCFDCYFMKLYFTKDMKPITFDKQKVIDDGLYYDFNPEDYEGARYYTFLAKIPLED